jgi:RES domain-containing protein
VAVSDGLAGLAPFVGRAAVAIQDGPSTWDGRRLISTDGNRWSAPGEPTICLAGDVAVALAELARHLTPDEMATAARVWTVEVHADAIADLRREPVRVGLPDWDDRRWVNDIERCRRLGQEVRHAGAHGMIVPSAAFPDRPERHNLVLFAENVWSDLNQTITDPCCVLVLKPR